MRIIALGDIHGRPIWKSILENETFDKVVFIGDYFDSRDERLISATDQIKNFNEIIAFKKANHDNVILLTGNHDFQYLPDSWETYSGFQKYRQKDIREAIKAPFEEQLLQMCWTHANMLFSHAGVTRTWCKENAINTDLLADNINELFWSQPHRFGFTTGQKNDNRGDEPEQPPTWVRPDSLAVDKIPGYFHIVGHTMQDNLRIKNDIVLIDTLGTSREYLVVENGEMYPQTAPPPAGG